MIECHRILLSDPSTCNLLPCPLLITLNHPTKSLSEPTFIKAHRSHPWRLPLPENSAVKLVSYISAAYPSLALSPVSPILFTPTPPVPPAISIYLLTCAQCDVFYMVKPKIVCPLQWMATIPPPTIPTIYPFRSQSKQFSRTSLWFLLECMCTS